MFDVGQAVLVITDRGAAYEGHIKARAVGDDGAPAYLIQSNIGGQPDQWHRSDEVYVPEKAVEEDPNAIETYLKK